MESFDILAVVVDDVVSDLEFWFPKPFESRSNKLLSLLLEITIVTTVLGIVKLDTAASLGMW